MRWWRPKPLDIFPAFANHDSRTGGIDRHLNRACGTGNADLADRCVGQAATQKIANPQILIKKFRKVAFLGVPC